MAVSHAFVAQAEDAGTPTSLALPSTVDLVQGRLYTLWIETGSTTTVASVTSPNETWVEVMSITVAGNGRLTLYRCEASGNRTDEQITVNATSSWTSASAILIETQGQTQGNNGADAILQDDTATGTATSATASLTNAPQSGSGVLAGFLYNANEAANAAGDSTELGNEFHATPTKGIIVVSDDDQSAGAAWTSNVAFGWIILEIDEAAAGGTNHTVEVDDTVSVADNIVVARGIRISVNDSAGVADALSSAADMSREVDDTLSLQDVLTRAAEYFRTVDDTVAIADQIQAGLAFARTVDDLVALADSVLLAAGYLRSVDDTVSVADAIDVDLTEGPENLEVEINDSVIVADSILVVGGNTELDNLMDLMWRFTRRRDARRTFGR